MNQTGDTRLAVIVGVAGIAIAALLAGTGTSSFGAVVVLAITVVLAVALATGRLR